MNSIQIDFIITRGIISALTKQTLTNPEKSGHGFLRGIDKPLRACLFRVFSETEQRETKRNAEQVLSGPVQRIYETTKQNKTKQESEQL